MTSPNRHANTNVLAGKKLIPKRLYRDTIYRYASGLKMGRRLIQRFVRYQLMLGLLIFIISSLLASGIEAADDWQPVNTQAAGQHPPAPRQSLEMLRVPDGFQVTLAASEPDVRQPIAIAFDARGRLWVAECYSYNGSDFTEERHDRILIFEDQDGDGILETRKVFQDGLNRLFGLAIGFGGVWIAAAPNVLFIPDKDGDDRPDGPPEIRLEGFTLRAEHNSVNGLTWGPDGWLYGRHGIKQPSLVGLPGQPSDERIPLSCCIWRYHPTQQVFEVVADGTVNPWGLDFDDYGEGFFSTSVVDHFWNLIPGARNMRRKGSNEHPNPYTYELMEAACDHLHWDDQSGEKTDRTVRGNDAFGGGHAHCDLMIYLGDRWPQQYRGTATMSNVHGRRLNQDRITKDAIGRPIGQHEEDFLLSQDPWFRAVSMEYGPDGDIFVTDWSDLGECHDRDGIDRNSGRIYKITWGAPRRVPVDLTALTSSELVVLQKHPNDWFVRQSRQLLQERSAAGEDQQQIHEQLREMSTIAEDVRHRLRAMWALFVTNGAETEWMLQQLHSDDERIRAWSIRLLSDGMPIHENTLPHFAALAANDSSWLVRRELASAARRFTISERWDILIPLTTNPDATSEANLERLIWYALEPAVAVDISRALRLTESPIPPRLRRFIARRVADCIEEDPQAIELLLTCLKRSEATPQFLELLTGLNQSMMRNRPQVLLDDSRQQMLARWIRHTDPQVSRAAITTGLILGNDPLVESISHLVHDPDADQALRHEAFEGLVARRSPSLASHISRLINAHQLLSPALVAAANVQDDDLVSLLLKKYSQFSREEKKLCIDALIARNSSTMSLLDAVEAGQIAAREISPQQAVQIAALPDQALRARLTKTWGTIGSTSQERRRQMNELKAALRPDYLRDANLTQGHRLFQEKCSACHKLFNEGQTLAPDLTGAQRKNLDYLLLNIIDPNAAVPADFRTSIILLEDGRVVTGCITATTDRALTVRTLETELYFRREEIDEIKTLSTSLMPEDLLKGLSTDEVRDLFSYLMSDGGA
ncbi:MAG TPA: PVC-type heme-binding CxxCH protein [Planctomicrobium sp.]|nr:PVC-type heme-binding CxxCH protein [Planctomicrobium sp.]